METARSVADFTARDTADIDEAEHDPEIVREEVHQHLAPPVTLTWRNVSFSVKLRDGSTRYILKDLSGIVEPGEVLCVMGPTGSGKTTFLDLLCGRISSGTVEGRIEVNGVPRKNLGDAFFRMSAFIPQFEAILPTLTVQEVLRYSCELNLPASVTKAEKKERINLLLKEFGLWSVRNKLVGGDFLPGISQGQKKRLSIAVELTSQRSLIFLDEPTTNQDSASAMFLMEKIIDLARLYKCTCVVTIHQPMFQIFEMFDKLLLLSTGRIVYMGPANQAPKFFAQTGVPVPEHYNPADWFLDVLNTDFSAVGGSASSEEMADARKKVMKQIDSMVETYQNTFEREEIVRRLKQNEVVGATPAAAPAEGLPAFHTTALHQFVWLLRRNVKDVARNPLLFWASFVLYVGLALFLGLLFRDLPMSADQVQTRISVLFFLVGFCTFMKVSQLPGYAEQREVFIRERLNGYFRVSMFSLAQFAASIPFTLVTTLFAAIAVYFLVGFKLTAEAFFYFTTAFMLCLMVAEGIVVMISSIIPQYIVGLALAAGLFGWFMLLCGFFLPFSGLPIGWQWAYWISFETFGFRSMLYNEFSGQTFSQPAPAPSIAGSFFLQHFKADTDNRGIDLIILLSMAIIYRFFSYVALRFLQTGKK